VTIRDAGPHGFWIGSKRKLDAGHISHFRSEQARGWATIYGFVEVAMGGKAEALLKFHSGRASYACAAITI
jgi:hypothetical protein